MDNSGKTTDDINPAETENQEALDDNDYVPFFIQELLGNFELLPSGYREDFEGIFSDFEFTHLGRAKTTLEFIEVYHATKLTLDIERYELMKDAILLNQQRPAVESLFRKTHDGAAMQNVESGCGSPRAWTQKSTLLIRPARRKQTGLSKRQVTRRPPWRVRLSSARFRR